jgi:hypothetical protein
MVGPMAFFHFIIPLVGNMLVKVRAGERPSTLMWSRSIWRFGLAMLAVFEALRVVQEVVPHTFLVWFLHWGPPIFWLFIGGSIIAFWISHPEGLRGL